MVCPKCKSPYWDTDPRLPKLYRLHYHGFDRSAEIQIIDIQAASGTEALKEFGEAEVGKKHEPARVVRVHPAGVKCPLCRAEGLAVDGQ
jgi:hypothetical protein